MAEVRTVDDVYPALDELIAELTAAGASRLAAVLHHRLHQVAWTARSELLEELSDLLTAALQSNETKLPPSARERIQRLLVVIRDYFNATPGRP